MQILSDRRGGIRGNRDPMLNGRRVVAVEPRRVVVELSPEEFTAIDKAAGGQGPADFIRELALRELGGVLDRV